MYHGTRNAFDSFDRSRIGQNYFASEGGGFFFTQKKHTAESYAALHNGGEGGNVMQVYLNIKNPLVREVNSEYLSPIDFYDMQADLVNEAELQGNDGIIIKGTKNDDLYVAFSPEQIKSVNNSGAFDHSNPNIYMQQGKEQAGALQQAAKPETGKPFTMNYYHNKEKAPKVPGDAFAQSIEPAGEYVGHDTMNGTNKLPNFEYGSVSFSNPLVLEHKTTGHGGWKTDLSAMFGGKKGKALSAAVKKAGHDGIITVDENGKIS